MVFNICETKLEMTSFTFLLAKWYPPLQKDRLQIINLSRELFFEHQHLDRKKEFENTSNDDDTIGITLDLIL